MKLLWLLRKSAALNLVLIVLGLSFVNSPTHTWRSGQFHCCGTLLAFWIMETSFCHNLSVKECIDSAGLSCSNSEHFQERNICRMGPWLTSWNDLSDKSVFTSLIKGMDHIVPVCPDGLMLTMWFTVNIYFAFFFLSLWGARVWITKVSHAGATCLHDWPSVKTLDTQALASIGWQHFACVFTHRCWVIVSHMTPLGMDTGKLVPGFLKTCPECLRWFYLASFNCNKP